MRFGDIKGNDAAVSALRSMVDDARVPHSLLFYENPSSGGMSLAIAYLQYLFCEHHENGDSCGKCPSCQQISRLVHPDVHFSFPVNSGDVIKADNPTSDMAIKEFRSLVLQNPLFTEQDLYAALGIDSKQGIIALAEAKDIVSRVSLSAVSGSYKAVVMFLPERMNPQAANKLLKTLEEPPSSTVFVMITQDPDSVLSTIYSRCQGLRIMPQRRTASVASVHTEEFSRVWTELLTDILNKDLFAALDSIESVTAIKSRDTKKAFLAYVSAQIRNIFLVSKGLEDLAFIDEGMEELTRQAAGAVDSKFCVKAAASLDKASEMIGRNVLARTVITDLVNRLYMYCNGSRK